MDSLEESSSKRNPVRLLCDSENDKNRKSTPREQGPNDVVENVFTSLSNPINSGSVILNGPRLGPRIAGPSHEPGPSNRSYDTSIESMRNNSSATCKQSTSSTDLNETPGSSKSSSSIYENGIESYELPTCQRHKVCMDKAGNGLLSTSSSSKPCDAAESNCKENRKRPSTLKLNRPNLDDDSSSDTGNDDYSLGSEDGCIYTYRGGEHLADLPSSFFSLDMGLPLDKHLPIPVNYQVPQQGVPERNSRASSPDMDFLEMDFDPGPSCEVDTGDESTPDADLDMAANMPEENEPVMSITPEFLGARFNPKPLPMPSVSNAELFCEPSTSRMPLQSDADKARNNAAQASSSHVYYGPYITHVNARGEQMLVRRTMSHWPHSAPVSLHVSSGDLVSPREILNYEDDHAERPLTHQINQGPAFDSVNLSSAVYHMNMAKKLMGEKTRCDSESSSAPNMAGDVPSTSNVSTPACEPHTEAATAGSSSGQCAMGSVEPPRCMVWSEREACERQVTQIGTSACGATAIVNVFIALGVPVNLDKINSSVGTRQRANNAPIPRYILSRAVAGCTAADLVNGIQRASDGLVTARFFPTYPERAISLSHWLADWISLGAVPILTLNLQAGCDGEIPDAWHHQMVFGVSSRGVYLCNPVECVRETALWPRLTSPSVLLVRARDVISRFTGNTDLTPLMVVPDRRFHSFNVLGQVVNVIREWRATGWCETGTRTRHIRVPAAYQAGVTVAALTGSEAHRRVMHAAQLPILAPQTDP